MTVPATNPLYAEDMTMALYRALGDVSPKGNLPVETYQDLKQVTQDSYNKDPDRLIDIIRPAFGEVEFGRRGPEQEPLLRAICLRCQDLGFKINNISIKDGSYTFKLNFQGKEIVAKIEGASHYDQYIEINDYSISKDDAGFFTRLQGVRDVLSQPPANSSVQNVFLSNTDPFIQFNLPTAPDRYVSHTDHPGRSAGHIKIHNHQLSPSQYQEGFRVYTALHGRAEGFAREVNINTAGNLSIQIFDSYDDSGFINESYSHYFSNSRELSAAQLRAQVPIPTRPEINDGDHEILTTEDK